MFEILRERRLPAKYHLLYKDIAFDGANYYLTLASDEKILKLGLDWQTSSVLDTKRSYACLCYDTREDCFWASSGSACSTIFRLNRSFQETECVSLNPFEGYVTALSYCSGDDTVSIAAGGYFLSFHKTSPKRLNKIRQRGPLVMGIGSIGAHYLCCELKQSHQALSVMTASGAVVKQFATPPQYIISSILIEREEQKHYHLQLLANKQGETYILEARLEKDEVGACCHHRTDPAAATPCGAEKRTPSSACACPPPPAPDCPYPPSCPPTPVCPPPLPDCPYPPSCPPTPVCPPPLPDCPRPGTPPFAYLPYPIYIPLPQQDSCPHMPFPCHPPFLPPMCPHNPQGPCYDEFFHSIAHVNCLIARILQAESEKLEQAAPNLEQVDQLLALNESTKRIITSVTHLEQTFYSLLDMTLRGSGIAVPKAKEGAAIETEGDTPRQ